MPLPYVCDDPAREPPEGLNGIVHVEVLDRDAPAGTPPQQTLLVVFKAPITGIAIDAVVQGGVRVPVEVAWSALPDAIPPEEPDALRNLDLAANTLVVRTRQAGDHSPYTLRIRRSRTDERPPDGMHPAFCEAPFSFKVECDAESDCLQEPACIAPPGSAPPLDYLARDYRSFRALMLDRMATLAPGWSPRSPLDLGVTLVEALAYAADQASYRHDAVATEAYLGTARSRTSVRRHAQLLGYRMHDGCAARAFVHVVAGPTEDVLPAPAPGIPRLRFLTGAGPSTMSPEEAMTALEDGAHAFEPLHGLAVRPSHNRIELHTLLEGPCRLPAGATEAILVDPPERLALMPGDVLILEEETAGPLDPRRPGADDPAGPYPLPGGKRHAVRLVAVEPAAQAQPNGTRRPGPPQPDGLPGGRDVVRVRWHPDDALPFALGATVAPDAAGRPVRAVARGNVVLCEHGATEVARMRTAPGPGGHPRLLLWPGIASAAPYDHAAAKARPAREAAGNALEALPAIRLRRALGQEPAADLEVGADPAEALPEEAAEEWAPCVTLLERDGYARAFVAEPGDDGSFTLRFGDGTFGRDPLAGTRFVVWTRRGGGTAGNVGPDTIGVAAGTGFALLGARNPLPAFGGEAPEPTSRVRQDAPAAFRRQQRAVTPADYEREVDAIPGVQRALARRRWTGTWHTMAVTADRAGGAGTDAAFVETVRQRLEPLRMVHHDLLVEAPETVSLDLAMTVCVKPGHSRAAVLRELREAFGSGWTRDGRPAFFHPDRWTFGQPLYLSHLVARAMDVPGVASAEARPREAKPSHASRNRFWRWGEPTRDHADRGFIPMGPREVLRVAGDPSQPELGRIQFHMEGGA